jgi:hypothetical protein
MVTLLALTLAIATMAFAISAMLLVITAVRGWRQDRRNIEAERRRIAAMQELLAREAVQPNGHVDHVSRIDPP